MGYKIIMKFVLALLAVAMAADECDYDGDKKEYKDTPADCEVPSCDGDLKTPKEGCTPEECTTDKKTPYEGCKNATCTDKEAPYKGCEPAECELDGDKYDKEDPYEGCTIPSCKGKEYVEADDEGKNCVPNDPGCGDPCKDRDDDDLPEFCAGGSNTGLIIVLALAAVGGLAGAFYCKHQKKACFKEKPEGGKFESLI